jgi:hypothetical protein
MDYMPHVDAVTYFHREIVPIISKSLPELKFVIADINPSRKVLEMASDEAVWVTGTAPDITPCLKGATATVIPMRIARDIENNGTGNGFASNHHPQNRRRIARKYWPVALGRGLVTGICSSGA